MGQLDAAALVVQAENVLVFRNFASAHLIGDADVLAGIPIQDEDRCTLYASVDYAYPQTLEVQIVAEMKGRFYNPYTGATFTGTELYPPRLSQ